MFYIANNIINKIMQYLKLFSVDTKVKFIFSEKIYSTADLCINFKKPTNRKKNVIQINSISDH